MGCEKCKSDMLEIPYIEHKKRLYKFYQKNRVLRMMLIATNVAWGLVVAALVAYIAVR